MTVFHSSTGASDFLGLRRSRTGEAEIVYDDGRALRMILRVTDKGCDESTLHAAMQRALARPRVLAALFAELQRHRIGIEALAP